MRLVGLCAFAALLAAPLFAQTQAQQGQSQNPPQAQQGQSQSAPQVQVRREGPAPKKQKKSTPPQTPWIEISANASFNRYTAPPSGYYVDMAGWNGAGEYNLRRWLGAQVELSGDYGRKAFFGKTSVYTFLAGPEFFPLRHHKITPWGHFLFGEGYYRNSIPAYGGFRFQLNTAVDYAYEAGAGVDINYKENWGIHVVQIDYISTRFLRTQPNEPAQSDYRASIGIFYRLRKRK